MEAKCIISCARYNRAQQGIPDPLVLKPEMRELPGGSLGASDSWVGSGHGLEHGIEAISGSGQ